MKNRPLLLIVFSSILFFGACRKTVNGSASGKQLHVFLSGTVTTNNSTPNSYSSIAAYWKDGQQVILSNDSNARATSIAVSGNDIYVAGNINDSTPGYWKNGEFVNLSYNRITGGFNANYAYAGAIFVSGNDVYILGNLSSYTIPRRFNTNPPYFLATGYWKNGVFVNLDGLFSTAIAVSGSDVYVAGYIQDKSSSLGYDAGYWKNGFFKSLPGGTIDNIYPGANVNAIAATGNDVYVAGDFLTGDYANSFKTACYWKNDILDTLRNGENIYGDLSNFNSTVNSMVISGKDVYFAGCLSWYESYEVPYSYPSLWKNNGKAILNDAPNLPYAYATSSYIAKSDTTLCFAVNNIDESELQGNPNYYFSYWYDIFSFALQTDIARENIISGIAVSDN